MRASFSLSNTRNLEIPTELQIICAFWMNVGNGPEQLSFCDTPTWSVLSTLWIMFSLFGHQFAENILSSFSWKHNFYLEYPNQYWLISLIPTCIRKPKSVIIMGHVLFYYEHCMVYYNLHTDWSSMCVWFDKTTCCTSLDMSKTWSRVLTNLVILRLKCVHNISHKSYWHMR